MIAFRCNAALLYFNVDNVREHMVGLLERAQAPLRRLIIDLAFTTDLDLSTVRMLKDFARRAAEDGVAVHLADAHYRVRSLLAKERCGPLLGDLTRSYSIAELVDGLEFDLPAPAHAKAQAAKRPLTRKIAAGPATNAQRTPAQGARLARPEFDIVVIGGGAGGLVVAAGGARSAPRSRSSRSTSWAATASGTAACRRRR